MKSILPFDNVETINDVLTHYHFRLVPSLGSKHTYELMDTRDYYSVSLTFPTSYNDFIFLPIFWGEFASDYLHFSWGLFD